MGLHWIDWMIVLGMLGFVVFVGVRSQKYNKCVTDFLSANRCAGRYLLGIAQGEAQFGAISLIASCEIVYVMGLARNYWGVLTVPLQTLIVLSGFVIYRYRATRALTMAQFFEMRYSRRFRIFGGCLAWISGIINFGIFPGVGARFFIHYCGFPVHTASLMGLEINLTLAAVMLILIGLALLFVCIGGQITVLVTDFWQGVFATFAFVAILAFLVYTLKWDQIGEALIIASPAGKSLIDPFAIGQQKDFNFVFYAISWVIGLYSIGAWQGAQAYQSSARTPHEAKMSRVMGQLKAFFQMVAMIMLPLSAITVMHHPDFADMAATVTGQLESSFDNTALQNQMRVPIVLSYLLPVGLLGTFAAAMLGFFISTNNTYMHSWGTIFIQDVVSPLRKTPLSPKQHIKYLRWSIAAVAVFAFFFSLLFPIREYIHMFFSITSAIFLGGAGSVIIGGLYWKRGTTAGAWAAMTSGCLLSTSSIILRIVWPKIGWLVDISPTMPVNSVIMTFVCIVTSVGLYVLISLFGKRHVVNMDKLLNRGEYAIQEEEEELERRHADHKPLRWYWKMMGVNGHEFSKVDKGVYIFLFAWCWVQVIGATVIGVLHFNGFMNDARWLDVWHFLLTFNVCVGSVGVIWITVGGFFDLKTMYKLLSLDRRDDTDDGRVTEHLGDDDDDDA